MNGYQGQLIYQNYNTDSAQDINLLSAIQQQTNNTFNYILRLGIYIDPELDENKQFYFYINNNKMVLGQKTYMYQVQDVAIMNNNSSSLSIHLPAGAVVTIDYVVMLKEE